MPEFDLTEHSYYACIQEVNSVVYFGFYQGIIPKVVSPSTPIFKDISTATEHVTDLIKQRGLTRCYQLITLKPVRIQHYEQSSPLNNL